MQKLLVCLLLVLCSNSAFAQSFDRIEGLGVDRANLTADQLKQRENKLLETQEFWVMRRPEMYEAPARIFDPQVWAWINRPNSCNADPYLIAAIGFTESAGRSDAVTNVKPQAVGWGQFIKKAMKEVGLKITEQKVTKEKPGWKGKGKKRKLVMKKVKETIIIDDRLDPEKSIAAVGMRLCNSYKVLGRFDLAVQAHHNGMGRLLDQLQLYTGEKVTEKNAAMIVAKYDLSFTKLFFDNTPYHKPKLYEFFNKIPNSGDTYYFKIKKAMEVLKLYEVSPVNYVALYQKYQTPFKADRISANRQWYFYRPEQFQRLQFQNLTAIVQANLNGRLVSLPQPWSSFGIMPRISGKSPIAEKDPENRMMYISAEPSVIGALLYAIDEVKRLQGAKFQPYEVNSMVRSIEYQERLKKTNGNAKTDLPIHTIGKAVDVPLKNVSKDMRRDLLFIFWEMDSVGLISYIDEDQQDTIHVVPHPDYEEFFNQVYMKSVGIEVNAYVDFSVLE
jgi:hypothetical protein